MTVRIFGLILFTLLSGHFGMAANDDLGHWRQRQDEDLRAADGWLTLVGLHWLKDGENTLGSGANQAVRLPRAVPERLAVIRHRVDRSVVVFVIDKGVTVDQKPIAKNAEIELRDDHHADGPSVVTVGSVSFHLIRRSNGVGVRVKDSEAATRKNFEGRRWYAPRPDLVVTGEWHPLNPPKKVKVPDVLGNMSEKDSHGYVSFRWENQEHRLYPTDSGNELFFVFRDLTAGKETYGAGRFLSANGPVNGKVTLDFNRAVNPPCAFTKFATCPLPPAENQLKVALPAGELKPLKDH